ncbi:alpha/beta hydrolase [Cobetia sp. QF-1]|uniref:alpha/beta hydrolase n=1 Tax=Cobetia sp. QF-1 TaxID=1969833 RepID=UPI001596191A|nr:alpha/beta hydrolase-fold protein [Cobetia sp. QF-1]
MLTSGAVSLPAFAMTHAADNDALPGTTTSFTQHSSTTGQEYLIQVALPKVAPPQGGYPVLMVLDGNRHLDLFTAARDILGRRGFDKAPSDLAIVAVGYAGSDGRGPDRAFISTARFKDFTPPLTTGTAPEGTGGGEDFLAYLTQALPPELASRYPLDLERPALVGHSLGGLFALHAQQKAPEAFGAIFAISPSLWWLQENDQASWPLRLACSEAAGPVYIAAGGREQSPQPRRQDPERDRLRVQRAMIDNAHEHARHLREHCPQAAVQWRLFEGEDHGSVMWPAARAVMERLLRPR